MISSAVRRSVLAPVRDFHLDFPSFFFFWVLFFFWVFFFWVFSWFSLPATALDRFLPLLVAWGEDESEGGGSPSSACREDRSSETAGSGTIKFWPSVG